MLTCTMIVSVSHDGSPDIECGKPARRTMSGSPSTDGCCDDCFALMLAEPDFSLAELEHMFPIAAP